MPDRLYERDALAWAERLNEPVDWPNVIEEVQDVGLSELRACQSLPQQAMVHLLKLHAWPGIRALGHWRDEAGAFLDDGERRLTTSMRQRTELGDLHARALRRARAAKDDAGTPSALPGACPFVLDDLLAPGADVQTLVQNRSIFCACRKRQIYYSCTSTSARASSGAVPAANAKRFGEFA